MYDNLSLAEFDPSESDRLAQWLAEDSWPFHRTVQPRREQVEASIASGYYTGEDNRSFWVIQEGYPAPVALICFHELCDPTPIFDLRIKSSMRNRGLGRMLVDWLVEYLFTKTDKHRIEGHTRVDNLAMRRVFKACGWVMEAYHRRAWPDSDGVYHDAITYTMLKCDWETGTPTLIDWSRET